MFLDSSSTFRAVRVMEMIVLNRVLIAGVVATVIAVPAAAGGQEPPRVAQPPADAQAAAQPTTVQVDPAVEAELKRQAGVFEVMLRQAVESGGQRLAQWARQVVPNVVLAQASNPVVQAVPLPDSSLIFNVQVPEILQTSVMLFQQLQRPQGVRPERPVANAPASGRVSGTGVVPDDPAAERVSDPDSLDPDRRYSNYVREALIDAMLDGSGVLQLQPGQWLTVAASGVDVAVVNPLYRNPSRKLVLSVKAEDLLEFRQQRITRDEVRSRILERRF